MKKITKRCLSFVAILGFGIAQAQTARIQVIHNCPDAAASIVDVYVNNELFLNDLAFRTATPFVSVPSGIKLC